MTRSDFSWFVNSVENATRFSDVWFYGATWSTLTKLQAKRICNILDGKGFIDVVYKGTPYGIEEWYQFPSGLLFKRQ